MKFTFKAKTKDGNIKQGNIDAVDLNAATKLLQKNDLIPIKITSIKEGLNASNFVERITSRVSQKDLLIFYRQLATLVSAKIPIATALRTILQQTESARLQNVISDIVADVEDGASVSDALSKHQHVFSPLTINMIRSGEVSGNLQGAIEFIAESAERSYQLKNKVQGALVYPVFVICVSMIIGFVTVSWILPKLTEVIKDMDVEIPWYTEVMIKLGDFMQMYWWAVLILIGGLIGAIIYYARSEDGRKEWDRIKLKIPIVGKLFRFVYVTRFAQNLSVLLKGGIPIVRSLIVVSDVVDNIVYKNIILKAAQDVKIGGEINVEFSKNRNEFPPMVASMIKIGENTGRISEILQDIADFYEAEVDQITRNLSSIIEPILIVFLGMGVGVLVFSVLLPIYNIAGQM